LPAPNRLGSQISEVVSPEERLNVFLDQLVVMLTRRHAEFSSLRWSPNLDDVFAERDLSSVQDVQLPTLLAKPDVGGEVACV
jgi:hypothetical protein